VALDPLADESHSIARAVAESLQGDDAAALLAPEDDARSLFVSRRAAWMSRAQAKKKKKKKKAKAKAAGTAVDVKSVTDGKPRQPNCAWQAHVTGSNINAGKWKEGARSDRMVSPQPASTHVRQALTGR
jgi:hypothetical protein